MDIVWIIIIVLAASLIKGITGFGFALVSLPLLLFWYSPREIIPVLILCNLFASLIIVLQKKEKKLVNRQFRQLIVFGAIFTIAGVLTLNYFPEAIIIKIVSVFFILLSVFSLVGVKRSFNFSLFTYNITGAFIGFLTGSISISGPPLAIFLHAANVGNREFREIFAWFSISTSVIALAGYGFCGLLTMRTFEISALFLPILFVGSYLGKKINRSVPVPVFKKSVLFITLASCVFLLLK